ncbi:BLOC-2 complex member HPS5-like [Rhopilema esculentum]|uniref:BLOC-2 complex member HPS5-like n=1 Tax=Rhopilema esculentum TaxID=499914 RepID=UPI0031E286C7
MMNPNDVGVSKDFLGYVNTIKRMRPSSNALDDTTVAMTLLYCALKETSAKSNIKMRYCGCGVAREGSHWLPWKEKGFIDNVLMNAVNSNDCGIVCRMFELCRKYGYWVGCIKVLRHLGQHKQVFEVMSQLGDFRLLDDYVKAETFSIQDDDLKHLCNLKYHIRDGPHKCRPAVPDFTRTITDESLARLLVRELGPKEALKMLNYFKEEFVPSSQFYYACLQISEKELEQRQLILKMMESLNSLSFNENKSMLQTQIEELKNRELSGDLPSDEALVMEDSYSTDLQSSNHWGVSLNISSSHCPSCTLPLCIHGASTNAGLVVFDCGHTFHKQCIPEESCIICYYKLDKFIQ